MQYNVSQFCSVKTKWVVGILVEPRVHELELVLRLNGLPSMNNAFFPIFGEMVIKRKKT